MGLGSSHGKAEDNAPFQSEAAEKTAATPDALSSDSSICNSELEAQKIRRGGVSVPLAFLINAWYSVNDPGFGSL